MTSARADDKVRRVGFRFWHCGYRKGSGGNLCCLSVGARVSGRFSHPLSLPFLTTSRSWGKETARQQKEARQVVSSVRSIIQFLGCTDKFNGGPKSGQKANERGRKNNSPNSPSSNTAQRTNRSNPAQNQPTNQISTDPPQTVVGELEMLRRKYPFTCH